MSKKELIKRFRCFVGCMPNDVLKKFGMWLDEDPRAIEELIRQVYLEHKKRKLEW